MRTKQTGKTGKTADPQASSNGMASATPKHMKQATPADTKSPAQPPDLSDTDKHQMKTFLDNAVKPFTVAFHSSSKKRKRDAHTYALQEDLWEDRLSVRYEVKPRSRWESLRRYKKFTGKWSKFFQPSGGHISN